MAMVPSKFLEYLVILCFDRQCPEQLLLLAGNQKCLAPENFGLATLLLVTTVMHTTCITLAPSHVPQY